MAERGDQTDLDQQNEMRQHSSFGRHIVKGMPFISHQPENDRGYQHIREGR
ncbi:MAG: hypothetical protein ACLSX5_11190 [Lachnospiraceae bacterium]